MIHVTIYRNSSIRSIQSFTVEGHAEYDERGKDIVCAGVSAVTVGTVNAIEALTGTVLANSAESGWLQAELPTTLDEERLDQVSLLLEAMLVMLRTIEQSYGKYISIQEIYR